VVKDTSNFKYSGARPKENRRNAGADAASPHDANVNLMLPTTPTAAAAAVAAVVVDSPTGSSSSALESQIRSTLSQRWQVTQTGFWSGWNAFVPGFTVTYRVFAWCTISFTDKYQV